MRKTTLLGVAVALATLAGGVLAAAPYDFTGHWTGHLQQARRSAATLTADFAMAGARSISGTLSLPGDDGQPVSCPANGKARPCRRPSPATPMRRVALRSRPTCSGP